MVVYGELLFAENAIIGAVLLHITGKICHRSGGRYRRLRLTAGSLMCGLFSLTIFLGIPVYMQMLMEIAFAITVCTAVFGMKQRSSYQETAVMGVIYRLPWKTALIFVLVTYFMGGMTMGLLLLTRHQGIHTAAGIYTGDMKAAVLVVFIWLSYMTAAQIIKTVRKSKLYSEHSCTVHIICGSTELKARAFFDTGNHLTEPVSGKPVAVASETLWNRMKIHAIAPEGEPAQEIQGEAMRRFALVPYETVGMRGMLEAVRVDMMKTEAGSIKGCYIAKSDGSFRLGGGDFSDSGENAFELLLCSEMADVLV